MARARSGGGGSGSIWGLVVFGAGFFICLILAILFYTRVEGAQQEAAEAEAELARVVNSADENSNLYADATADGSGTMVNRLLARLQDAQGEIGTLQGQILDLNSKLSTAQTQLALEKQTAADAQASLQQATQARQSMESELRNQVQSLSSTINDISSENDRLKGLVDASIQEVDDTYRSQITGYQQQIAEQEDSVAQLNRTVEDLRYQLSVLAGDTPESPALTTADATIVSQIPDQNKVFLDIGRNSNLVRGMAFQVFDPEVLVKLEDADDLAEGKAVVEIINLSDNTSVGRIVQRQGRAQVRNGDKVVNLVFDPNRVFTFHLFGQFDLDYDGSPDEGGLSQVKSMVRRFNGRLSDEMNFATDYLVLGVEPELPTRPDDELDLIKMQEYRAQLENYNAYQERISQARELGIPVLNQNRFLDLVGYFER
jgi:hypothetical protein